ncbi:ROK family transcriptional regulator [Streptomyces sp. ACA25]|uniref:ROK family transcriptional regulator n=1 Tax=Streptomyces sp. ACA25 TaxID=3022596 RepID=UPI0023077EB2|nr:ROK family transcriptional regulator [Streptomyces sp. ACA25]MDB1090100.1 ROK family transcriptional regulator [Streptomyces sp. ACA25]
MRAGPSQEEIRRQNLSTLLRHIHLGGPASRAVLADRMGLNRSTILALVSELSSAGLVREELPRETGRAGRPSLVVQPESHRVHVLAFDVGVDYLAAARVGLGGVFLDRRETTSPEIGRDPGQAVAILAGYAGEMTAAAPADSVCAGAAAAVRGMVRHPDGLVRSAPNIGWLDEDFGGALTRRLGLDSPVLLDNESNLGALAEHLRGAGTGLQDLIYLHGDIGIGGGIISGGRLLRGHQGYGGEVGHMLVNPRNGRRCSCGSRGCLEAEAGQNALLEAAHRQHHSTTGRKAVQQIVEAADRGDVTARAALHAVGDWLAIGIANLVNLYNPATVIFGGNLPDIYLSAAAQIRSRINSHALAAVRESTRFRVCRLGNDTLLNGAAELAFTRLLTNPLDHTGL